MALDFTVGFARLGKIGKFILAINTQQALWDDKIEEIADEYDDTLLRDAISGLLSSSTLVSGRNGVAEIYSQLQRSAENTIIAMVLADQPSKATSITAAIEEWRRQMVSQAKTVKAATVSVTSTALSTNSGNGVIVSTTKRGDGKVQELTVAEVGFLTCTADSQTGGATLNQETFTFAGEADTGEKSAQDWPTGSAGTATVTCINPTLDDDGGNVLTNSDFEVWSGTPLAASSWSITTGTYGTDVVREGTEVFKGTYGVKLVGGATVSAIRQTITSVVEPQRSYAFNIWAKRDVAPAAGVLTVEILDGSLAVINDDAGVANSFTIALTGLTASFVAYNGVFRMPKLLPDTVYLRLRLSTALSAGTNVYIDESAMGLTTPLYSGGPSIAIFPGSTKWVAGDGWTLDMANDRGGVTFAASFNALFDRLFGMRANAQQLPTAASPTHADTLISA